MGRRHRARASPAAVLAWYEAPGRRDSPLLVDAFRNCQVAAGARHQGAGTPPPCRLPCRGPREGGRREGGGARPLLGKEPARPVAGRLPTGRRRDGRHCVVQLIFEWVVGSSKPPQVPQVLDSVPVEPLVAAGQAAGAPPAILRPARRILRDALLHAAFRARRIFLAVSTGIDGGSNWAGQTAAAARPRRAGQAGGRREGGGWWVIVGSVLKAKFYNNRSLSTSSTRWLKMSGP